MTHVLTPEYKQLAKRVFWVRLASLAAIALALAAFIGSVALIPAYIRVLHAARDIMLMQGGATLDTQEATDKAADAQAVRVVRAELAALALRNTLLNDVFDAVARAQDAHHADISVARIGYTTEGSPAAILISGTASTREAVLAFVKALQGTDVLASAKVPVSDLAGDAELAFTVHVTLKKTTKETTKETTTTP